jgi:RNA recognition motif-containing protein
MTLDTDKLSRSVAGLLRDLRRPRDGFEDGENKQNVYLSRRFLKRPEEHKKLFVCNIAFTIDKDELETIFASYGPIKDLNLFQRTDHNGKPKTRYAFVTYETHEDAQAALELDGKLVDYRALNVRIARPNKKNHSINR